MQHRSAGARQELLARLQEHVAAIYSIDFAEAAGSCDADGTALLASLGLDGPPQAQASAPGPAAAFIKSPALAKRKVSPAFVLYWE